jgi:hypothetical protein
VFPPLPAAAAAAAAHLGRRAQHPAHSPVAAATASHVVNQKHPSIPVHKVYKRKDIYAIAMQKCSHRYVPLMAAVLPKGTVAKPAVLLQGCYNRHSSHCW